MTNRCGVTELRREFYQYSIMLLLFVMSVSIPSTDTKSLNTHTKIHSDLLPSNPIYITEEQDFINQGWPGDGTYGNPFRIEGLMIESTNDTPCIRIWNTNETYWIISDCMISGSLSEGIRLQKSGYGRILSSNITACMNGIEAVLSEHLEIRNCRIWNCSDTGIFGYGRNIDIRSNEVIQSTEGRDAIKFSDHSEPIPNSDHNVIEENQIYGSITISSSGTVLMDNDIYPVSQSDSISITSTQSISLDTNSIYSSLILGYSKFVFISDCTFQPYQNIIGRVVLREMAINTTFRNCDFFGIGMLVGNSVFPANVSIVDCIFESGDGNEGILFTHDVIGEIRFSGCTISNYSYGLYIWSANVTGSITDSVFMMCYTGAQIRGSNFTISDNSFLYNENGLQITGNHHSIFNNRFACNTKDAYDSGEGNTWDDGLSVGNWWQSYEGEGVYEIPGPAGSIDRYPRFYDYSCVSSTLTTTDTHTPSDDGLVQSGFEIGVGIALIIAIVLVIIYTRKR